MSEPRNSVTAAQTATGGYILTQYKLLHRFSLHNLLCKLISYELTFTVKKNIKNPNIDQIFILTNI